MTSPLDRLSASLADRYRLDRELGAGGMATVFLAEDLKHRRRVALKVLRPELSAVIGAERFLKEIETTANLQHPHILPLHDSGEVDGTAFYVMPFVEGETLRDRLDREKQLPIADAVRIAREIASALDYAHRKGVIHRDIKPENILLHEGQALVADFGIALAAATTSGTRMTETGMSLGTPHYMSPEQAMGERTLDARSDVYALGCVLYEMLVGEPPFTGPTAQAIVARVLTGAVEAPIVRRSTVPANVNAAVLTALQKLPADRFASAAAMSEALQDRTYAADATHTVTTARSAGTWNRFTIAATAIAGAAVLAATWAFLQRPAPAAQRAMRVVMELPDSLELDGLAGGQIALSPDGSRFVFSARKARPLATSTGVSELWLRSADKLEATAIAAAKRASFPSFSPDGRHLGYVAVGEAALKVVDLDGGTVRTVADTGVRRSPIAFAPDGSIIATSDKVLVRFPADGGSRATVSTIDTKTGESDHVAPDVLPNGKGVLFTVWRTPNVNISLYDIAVLDLKSGQHHILANGVAARYVAGHLLIVHANGILTAAPFDQDSQQLTGAEVQIASDVRVGQFGNVDLVVSGDGMLAYASGSGANADANLIWMSRDGTVMPIDSQWRANFDALSLSPDGRQIAVSVGEGGAEDVWIKQLDGGKTKLTLGGGRQYRPRWLPDGKSVSFLSEDVRPFSLAIKRADGIGAVQRIAPLADNLAEGFVSADGQWVIMRTTSTAAGRGDIFARRLGDSVAIPLVVTKGIEERHPALSPDGKWLAYRSTETGRGEVYVRPFPNVNDGKWLVSLDGGGDPVWSHSGRELFYVTRSDELWSATVATSPAFSVLERKKLFALPAGVRPSSSSARFDVAPGDQRFLMIQSVEAAPGASSRTKVVLLTNVLAELQAKAGVKK